MAILTGIVGAINFSSFNIKSAFPQTNVSSSATEVQYIGTKGNSVLGGVFEPPTGGGLIPPAGIITSWATPGSSPQFIVDEIPDVPFAQFQTFLAAGNSQGFLQAVFAGDDSLTAASGSATDRLFGYDGDDTINGGGGADYMNGGAGDDVYVVDSNSDRVIELSDGGVDTVRSTAPGYRLNRNVENLELIGTANINGYGNKLDNVMTGNAGNNTLVGEEGNDTLLGGAGNDFLAGKGGNDSLEGQAGNDYLRGYQGNDVLDGGEGNDSLDGGEGDDTIIGGDGNDTVIGGAGVDEIAGGEGADSIDGGKGNDIIAGDGGNDTIQGGAGNDTLGGGDGDDSIKGGAGNDSIEGGGGNDRLDGDDGNDSIDGGAGNDTLFGGRGNDLLEDILGNNVFDGGPGADTMIGGPGNDTYYVDNVNDVIQDVGGIDTVVTSLKNYLAPAGIEFVQFIKGGTPAPGTAGVSLVGGEDNTDLVGTAGNDTLSGGGAFDVAMTGGAGNDVYVVDSPGDQVVEGPDGGNDTIFTSVQVPVEFFPFETYILPDNVENLVMEPGARNAQGNDLDNTITGNDEDNVIDGGAGNNIINGGGGNDSLNGGQGGNDGDIGGPDRDIFYFDTFVAPSFGTDTVFDFTQGEDLLNLAYLGYESFEQIAGDISVENGNSIITLPEGTIVVDGVEALTPDDFSFDLLLT